MAKKDKTSGQQGSESATTTTTENKKASIQKVKAASAPWPTHDLVSFDWATTAVIGSSTKDDMTSDPLLLCRLRLDVAPRRRRVELAKASEEDDGVDNRYHMAAEGGNGAAVNGPSVAASTAIRQSALPSLTSSSSSSTSILIPKTKLPKKQKDGVVARRRVGGEEAEEDQDDEELSEEDLVPQGPGGLASQVSNTALVELTAQELDALIDVLQSANSQLKTLGR